MISKTISSTHGITLYTESFGNPHYPACLLIAGAGAPARFWTDHFCKMLAHAGYYVIRFDHRDTGLSAAVDFENNPYTVHDLAHDALAILDAYNITQAHIVGHSMGGMVAQLIAIEHPERVLTLTSLSVGTVGGIGTPPEEIMTVLLANKPNQNFEESSFGFMKSWRILNGIFQLDEQIATAYTKDLYVRSRHPVGVAWNHIKAQEGFHNLQDRLAHITVPTLCIHGDNDPLIPIEAGQATAHAIPRSQFVGIPGMGHMIFNQTLEEKIAHLLIEHFKTYHCMQLLERNLYAKFLYIPHILGYHLIKNEKITIINSHHKSSMFNIICDAHLDTVDMQSKIKSVISSFNGNPCAWWIGPSSTPLNLGSVLTRFGFVEETQEIGMWLDFSQDAIDHNANLPAGFTIKPITEPHQWSIVAQLIASYDPEAAQVYTQLTAIPIASLQQARYFVGYYDHQPVALCSLFFSNSIAGIFDVYTLRAYRGRGFASAMTRHAITIACKENVQGICLTASSTEGNRVYEKIGFRVIGQLSCYEYVAERKI